MQNNRDIRDIIEIELQINESISIKQMLLNAAYLEQISQISKLIMEAFKRGSKLLLCGNGGSAADAQHIAGEFVARFEAERRALPAIALNANSSSITAIGNDYAYEKVFSRQIDAFGLPGDVLLAISTSGNSKSILDAMGHAKLKSMHVTAMLGKGGGSCLKSADLAIVVPSERTSRIQEAHIMIGHIICSLVEKGLFDHITR